MEKNNSSLVTKIIAIVAIAIICLGVIFTFLIFGTLNPVMIAGKLSTLSKSEEILRTIDRYYYGDIDPSSIDSGIYRGLVSGLNDPYSTYYTKEEFQEFNVSTSMQFGGIGAALLQDPDTKIVSINYVYDDTPAAKGGLAAGDIIVSANDKVATEMDLETFVTLLRGEPGTKVNVTYARDGVENTITLTREEITVPTVNYELLKDHIGYIRITNFAAKTENEFKKAVEDLVSQGADSMIYDVRSNPGGYVDSATAILDFLLPKGNTLFIEDKYGKRITYSSDEENKIDLPCAVLVDEYSASASEIFAGVIKDYEYGKIIGTNTHGKGVVQNTFTLRDKSAIKLTIAEYLTPKETRLHGNGIAPDITVEYEYYGDENEDYDNLRDSQVVEAVLVLERENSQPQ